MVELLTLRRRTNVDILVESVPRPESGVPAFALPGWRDVALDLKLPMLNCPNNQIIFSRAKVGQKLWKKFENSHNDFKIAAMSKFKNSSEYQPLHDPHLKKFYKKSPFKEKIKEIGEVTSTNDVICKLQEFNEYRKYLQQVHVDSIIAKRKMEDEEEACKTRLTQVNLYRKKEEKLINVLQQRDLLSKDKRLEMLKNKELRKKKLIENQIRCKEAYERYKQLRKLKTIMLREKSYKREKLIKKGVAAARQEILRWIISVAKRNHITDLTFNSKLNAFRDDKLKQKRILAEYRWKLHLLFREMYQYKTMNILKKNKENITRNVNKRNAYVQQQWEDIENGIVQKRISKIRENYEKRDKKQFRKAIKRSIRRLKKKKKISKKDKKITIEQEEVQEVLNIDKNQENILKLSNYDKHVSEEKLPKGIKPVSEKQLSDIIKTSMTYVAKEQKNTNSMSVLICAKKLLRSVNKDIDFSIDNDCLTFTAKRVEEIMDGVTERVLEAIKKVFQIVCHRCSNEDLKPINVKKSTESRPISQKFPKIYVPSRVSFGNVTHIEHVIEEGHEMKSVKDRAPTPVASLSSLAVTVLDTPNIEDNLQMLPFCIYDKGLNVMTQDQLLFIEYKLVKFKKRLLKRVEYRTYAGIDFKGCRRIMKIRHDVLDIEKSYLINIMTKAILGNNQFIYSSNFRLMTSYVSFHILREIQNMIDKYPNKMKRITNHLLKLNKCKCHL